jgi:serine protease Do
MNKSSFAWVLAAPVFLLMLLAEGFGQSADHGEKAAALVNLSASIADLVQKVRPSVVQIRTAGYGEPEGQNAGWVTAQRGTGSGVILDEAGFIVTNAHVVKGARYIEVWLNNAESQIDRNVDSPAEKRSASATLVGIDTEIDLAVIKIERTGLVPLKIADSDALRQGQIVLAMGNPMALENSASMGVISSTERQLKPDDAAVYIQTDAPINPGNSGGPLVDVQGRLVGLNTFIYSQSGGSEGIGFAIPSNVISQTYSEIKKTGHTHHGRIGIYPRTVTPTLAAGLQLPRDWGAILEDVDPEGPAAKAGLQPGDLIMAADGLTIRNMHQLLRAIDRHAIGEVLKVSILRGSAKLEAAVAIELRDDDPNRFLEMVADKANPIGRLGILALNPNAGLLKMVPDLRKPAGVIVAARVVDSGGAQEFLIPGDLLISLNGKEIPNVDGLIDLLNEIKAPTPLVFQVQREDQLRFIVVE